MPHYLRFVRTLALATTLALPACADGIESTAADEQGDPTGSATTSSGTGTDSSATAAPTAMAIATETGNATATATPTPVEDAGTSSDASPGFSSGPLPPPDMPASMA